MGSNLSYYIDTAKLQGGETLHIENQPKLKNRLPKAADLLRELPKVKHIIVRNCKLSTLPQDLNLLSNLTHLDLEGNNFREIPVQLKNLTNLKSLILRRNQCENFPVLVSELKVLSLLDVSDNEIERIPYKLTYGFPELQILHYARNNLQTVPEAVADLKSLTFLNLSGNKLQDLGSFISQLTNLQKLVLSYNAFDMVPHVIGRLTKLEHLDISNNRLTKCEDVFPFLTNLKRLELQHNAFEIVTHEMLCLPNLEILKLNDNRISKIASNLGQLQKLEELYLHENLLTTIPSSVGGLCSLKKLFLEFNYLQSLPIELTKLEKLHWLFLHNNKLKTIPEALRNISFLTNLVALSLGNNDFEPKQQQNIVSSGALNYCIKRAQDTLKAKEAFSRAHREGSAATPKLPLNKQNLLQRASSSSRLPRFSRGSIGSSAVVEDPNALVKAFENLLMQHDFSDKLKENLRQLPALEKLNFLTQYHGISLNLLAADSSNPQSRPKPQADESLSRMTTSTEHTRSQNKGMSFFTNVKGLIHKEGDSAPSVARAQSTEPILSTSPPSSTFQQINLEKENKSKRRPSLSRVANLKRPSAPTLQLPEEDEAETEISQKEVVTERRSPQKTRPNIFVRDRSMPVARRRTKSGESSHKKRSLSAEDDINHWINKLSGRATQKDLFSLRVRFLSHPSSWWLREFITNGGMNAIFKILAHPLDKETPEDEGMRLEALRILNVLLKADLSSMLMLSDSIPVIVQNLLCPNELVKQSTVKVLLRIANAGGVYQGIVAEALIKATKVKGPKVIFLQLFKELSEDNPEEYANIKGCMTLINIILEKSESLEVRFDNVCHFLAMKILKVFKKIRQTVAKQSISGDIKELLEEIDIFEQQLHVDVETLANRYGPDIVIDQIRSRVNEYVDILTKKKNDESPFLYDPSDEPLLRALLHSPRTPTGEWNLRVRIPKYQRELQITVDFKTGHIGDRTAYRKNSTSSSNPSPSPSGRTSRSHSAVTNTPPETPKNALETSSDSSPLQSSWRIPPSNSECIAESGHDNITPHFCVDSTQSLGRGTLSSTQSVRVSETTNTPSRDTSSASVSEKCVLPPLPPPPTPPSTPHTTASIVLPPLSTPLPPPLNIPPPRTSASPAVTPELSGSSLKAPNLSSSPQLLTVGHLLKAILSRVHVAGIKLSEYDDDSELSEDNYCLYCITKREYAEKQTVSNAPLKDKSLGNSATTKNSATQSKIASNKRATHQQQMTSGSSSNSSGSTLDSPSSNSGSQSSGEHTVPIGLRKQKELKACLFSGDEEEDDETSSVLEFLMDNNALLTDYRLDNKECILELRRKPVNIRVKTFGDTYEEMSFDLSHSVSKIKKELANKILGPEQRKLWNSTDYCLILETSKQESLILDDNKPLIVYNSYIGPLNTLRMALRPHPIRVCEYRQPSHFITVEVFFTYPIKLLIVELCRQFGIPFPLDSTSEMPMTSRIPYTLVYHEKADSKGKLLSPAFSLRGQGIVYNDQGFFELVPASIENERETGADIWSSKEKDDLILDQNNEIQAVSLNVLIEMLTSDKGGLNQEDLNTFLLTYQSFTTPEIVLQKLIERWRVPENIDNQTKQSIQVRVLVFLKYWIEYSHEVMDDPIFVNNLKNFAREIYETNVKYQGSAESLLKQIASKNPQSSLASSSPKPSPIISQINPSGIITPSESTNVQLNVLDIDEMELARQLTYLIGESFFRIKSQELLGQVWNDTAQVAYLAPNVHATIRHFNYTSNFVTRSIVLETKLKNRRKIYKKFIKVAKHLRDMKNFHSLTAVLSGLSNAAVSRLTWTRKVSKSYRTILEDLEALMSMGGGFRNYRQVLDQCVPPCIPYMGAILMDLTFIEDGNLDNVGTLINWSKRKALYKILNKVIYYQTTAFDIQPLPEVQAFLRQVPQLDETELFEISLLREPPNCKRTDLE